MVVNCNTCPAILSEQGQQRFRRSRSMALEMLHDVKWARWKADRNLHNRVSTIDR